MKQLLLAMALATAAVAQPVENVTVTGTRDRRTIEAFVQSYVVPTRLTGKIARWQTGICPRVIGLPPGFSRFITARLKAVAMEAGAPLGKEGCETNIQIVFTDKPQALLDRVRDHAPDLLGYIDSASARADAAIVRRPIQAWTMTETVDVRGYHFVDSSVHGGGLWVPISPKLPPVFIPHAHAVATTGMRLGDGLRSDLYHVLIVADPTKLKDYEMGALADHIAMLALSQPTTPDCLALPSVLNLFTEGCPRKADALTDNDRAFLAGLYKMTPDRNLRTQEDQMAFHMEQTLLGK